LLAFDNIKRPLAVIWQTPGLLKLSMVGVWLSIGHGCWVTFLVSYLVIGVKMPIEVAGMMFAVMQLAGIVGRMLLGLLADRIGSAIVVLGGNVLASFLTSVALVIASPSWPPALFVALVAFAGVSVSSWNGLQIAEVSRRAPAHLVAESAAGVTLMIFAGYIVGPICFSVILALTGRFDVAFGFVALATLPALLDLRGLRSRSEVNSRAP
jgi:MFS family permease